MTRRRVSVEINELALDGCCAPRDADRVAAALTGELERLLRLEPPAPVDRGEELSGGGFVLQPSATPESIGRDVARAVHRSLLP